MRVISGLVGGFKLKSPTDSEIRPTSDRTREALFNVIAPWITDAVFLDLFCGTGANGIEALSRGAAQSVFVDNSSKSCAITKENLEHTKLSKYSRVICTEWQSALKLFYEEGVRFNIIFLDPPYRDKLAEAVVSAVKNYDLLTESGFIIIESMSSAEAISGGFSLYRDKKYGLARLTIFRNE